MESFSSAFKSEEFADLDVVLVCASGDQPQSHSSLESEQAKGASTKEDLDSLDPASDTPALSVVARFPAHRLLLCKSEYIKAQVQRWQPEPGTERAWHRASEQATSHKRARDSADDRPQLQLTLDSPDQQAAAEAVLATLYYTGQPLSELNMEQLVQAILIADRLQIASAAQRAVKLPTAMLKRHQEVPIQLIRVLCNLGTWPGCLAPVLLPVVDAWQSGPTAALQDSQLSQSMQHMLVAVFGRLNVVWEDAQLQRLILRLPVAAMELLLSSDNLSVDSEDTVAYTAQQYCTRARGSKNREVAETRLPGLIRCPQLSTCFLTAVALGGGEDNLLCVYQQQLQQLLSLRLLSPINLCSRVQAMISGVPASWMLPRRLYTESNSVHVTWRVNVEQLRKACAMCCKDNAEQTLCSPVSGPKAGVGWNLVIGCKPVTSDGEAAVAVNSSDQSSCCLVGLYVGSIDAPPGAIYRFSFNVAVRSVDSGQIVEEVSIDAVKDIAASMCYGWEDFFELGAMAGGFDECAWTGKGLPAAGVSEFELRVDEVQGEQDPLVVESDDDHESL